MDHLTGQILVMSIEIREDVSRPFSEEIASRQLNSHISSLVRNEIRATRSDLFSDDREIPSRGPSRRETRHRNVYE